jgi:ABC-type multidrug transport system ATPase subunit|tara:strand:- start:1203 stop:2141 length:939 start_codon:yes stop_codon:yes gene_type:complete
LLIPVSSEQRIALIDLFKNLFKAMNTLSISNLSKTYPNGVEALKGVSIEINNGLFGLLGPNGAGKSSLMRTIATLQKPDSGSVILNQINVEEHPQYIRKSLGYLPQEFGVYPTMTAEILLDHFAVLKGISDRKTRKERVDYLLDQTNLFQHRKKKLGGFSGGMKQRFGIAQALLANPSLIIVDEPTAGLDPTERNRFHNLLSELGQEAIVILSTHFVDDVKELCTNMAILNSGKLLWKGSPQQAINEIEGKVFSRQISRSQIHDYKEEYSVIAEQLFQGKPLIYIYSESDPGQGFLPVEPDLNHVYFNKVHS